MTTDLLRTEANERVDKGDFDYLADGAIQAEHRQVMGDMFTDSTRLRAWILDGFAIDCPVGKQVRVTRGRAVLSQRVAGEVKHGVLATGGDATKTVDINAFGAGTYGIYVRFELVSGDLQSRIFWNPLGDGFEYANTIATRYQANWSLRVESGSPGAEWLLIGEVDQATLAPSAYPDTGITDQREFYYEGKINHKEVAANFTWNGTTTIAATGADTTEMAVGDFIGVKADGQLFEIVGETPNVDLTIDNSSGLTIPNGPAGAKASFMDDGAFAPYASGWSADGGTAGTTADDRKNKRQEFGVADAQMFNAAIRQCIEDIKGRGLRRWWEREIGGMNIGFDADPVEDVLAIGDANFNLVFNPTAAAPGSETPRIIFHSGNDYFEYDRSVNTFKWRIGGALAADLNVSGLFVYDTEFGLMGSAVPALRFATTAGIDEFRYDRVANRFEFMIASALKMSLDAAGLLLAGALTFGQVDLPQNIISSLIYPLNGVTVLAKNNSGGALTQGMLVMLEDQALAYICVEPTANANSRVIGTVYDAAGIANGASGKITIWGPGHLRITGFAAGTAGTRIGPSAVAGVGTTATAYYVGWIPYTQAAGAGERLIEGFIEGCQFI